MELIAYLPSPIGGHQTLLAQERDLHFRLIENLPNASRANDEKSQLYWNVQVQEGEVHLKEIWDQLIVHTNMLIYVAHPLLRWRESEDVYLSTQMQVDDFRKTCWFSPPQGNIIRVLFSETIQKMSLRRSRL
jgi:hypothetical protein